jgi:hypothetical protein
MKRSRICAPTGGITGEAAHRLAVADHVGDHGNHRRRHFGKIEARIGELRFERDRGFSDVDDTHCFFSFPRPAQRGEGARSEAKPSEGG